MNRLLILSIQTAYDKLVLTYPPASGRMKVDFLQVSILNYLNAQNVTAVILNCS